MKRGKCAIGEILSQRFIEINEETVIASLLAPRSREKYPILSQKTGGKEG